MRIKKDYTNIEGYIYKIESPSGKIYIGQTINIINRKSCYKRMQCKTQPIIYNSLKKYGWEQHKFEIIEKHILNIDKKILNEREIFWIDFYNSFGKNGMNCNKGGNGQIGYVTSEETKQKLRNANLGKKLSQSTKDKISKNNSRWNKGKKYKTGKTKIISEETKQKLRNANLGKKYINRKQSVPPWNKDKKQAQSTKDKISAANKGKIPWNKGLKKIESI